MSRLSPTLRGALCVAALLLAAVPVSAAVVPLDTSNPDFADRALNDGDTATDGTILLTFGNVLSGGGGNTASVDGDGIFLTTSTLSPPPDPAVSFTIIFDKDTMIDEYTVSYPDRATTGFQLAGANGTSGLNALTANGTFAFDMGSIPYFAASQAYTLTAPGETGYSQLRSLNISEYSSPAPAPAPATALLLAGGLVGLRMRRRSPRRA